ncbi:MAG: AmmeMemoRadiSam system radical SAM enzyme [Candidatus Geothermincolia bacterium]
MKEAAYYEKLGASKVHCHLCPQECRISEGKKGFCRVRSNDDGTLYSDIYERVLAANMDPIEKKPLYHFHPGTSIFSIGTRGCNQRCDFCQNWEMLETDSPGTYISSDEVVRMAGRGGSIGIAYTYNEPMMWFEFVLECAKKVRERGLKNVLVTNGSVNPEPLEELLPFVDAMNIDVKSMDPEFYRKICKSKLEPVLATVKRAIKECHIEITNLVIPTLNDSDELLGELIDFVASLGRETPLHFSAYYPCYKMTIEATPLATLQRAYELARKKLDYVYMGNVRSQDAGNSCCPGCGEKVVERDGYITRVVGLDGPRCANCGAELPFVV